MSRTYLQITGFYSLILLSGRNYLVGDILTERELDSSENAMLNVSILVHDKVMVSLVHVILSMLTMCSFCDCEYSINPC